MNKKLFRTFNTSIFTGTVNVQNFEHFLVFGAGMPEYQTGKTPIRLLLIKQSDLGLHCLSRPFLQATAV